MEKRVRTGLISWLGDFQVPRRDLRHFGWIMGGILVLVHYFRHHWSFSPIGLVGIAFLLTGAVAPQLLKVLYLSWMKIGHFLGAVNSRIILAVIYAILFVPVGLVLRLIGKRLVDTRFIPSLKTYRIAVSARDVKHFEFPY